MYNPNQFQLPPADTPPTPIRRRWGFSIPTAPSQSAGYDKRIRRFSISAAPTQSARLERSAVDDAVVKTPHWG